MPPPRRLPKPSNVPMPPAGFQLDQPTREPVDGDTVRMQHGGSLRLWGVDAPETKQQGWDSHGRPVPIGTQATSALSLELTKPGEVLINGGPRGMSYGRPVAPLNVGGQDVGLSMLRSGNAMAMPNYLGSDPTRRFDYMQAERLARQNRLGMHQTFHQTPEEFRHDPIIADRETVAQFWDTPTPWAGMRPEDEAKYVSLLETSNNPDEIAAFAKRAGGIVDPAEVGKWLKARDDYRSKGRELPAYANYQDRPKVLTDMGDGATGAAVRGLGNGVLPSLLEEAGAIPDSLGLTDGRENVWNSDRRFADIYANNLDQNEAITGFDHFAHPWATTGGELAGSLVVPIGRVRSAADLAKWGAMYGGVSGLGQPGTIPQRLTSGVIGAGEGLVTSVVGGKLLEAGAPYVARGARKMFGRGADVPPVSSLDHFDGVPSTPEGFSVDPPRQPIDIGESRPPSPIAMDAEPMPGISQEMPARTPDYLFPERPYPISQPMGDDRLAAIADDIAPQDVLPRRPGDPAPGSAPVPDDLSSGSPDFAGNINLSKLDTPQDIQRALTTVDKRFGFDEATRGRVTQEETARLASDLGMTPDQLLARRKGQAFNAEEALAARQILAKSGNELVNLARRVHAMETPGDDVLAQFSQALRRHAAIQEQVSGMTAEAGRTLQQFRMLADSRKVPGEVLGRLVDMNGGRGRLEDAAQTIIDTIENEPGKFNPLIEKLSKPRWIDKAIELRYNMLLSGPQTHAANIISNTLTTLGQFPEHLGAATIGLGRRGVMGAERSADRVYPSELTSRAFGLLSGVKEGLGQFVRTLRTGQTSDLVTKVEAQGDEVISGLKGKIIRTPSRMLSAEDELFKAMARKMELYGLANRQASSELLSGKARANRIAELVANPPDDMLERTFDYARYLTYQRPLSGIPQSAAAMTNKHPTLKFIVPFVRTPTNLLKYAAERSPAAPLIKEWRADMMAGGARRDLAISKAVVGSGVALWMADLAAQGIITGSPPDDPNKERLLRADGWQPNSIRVGDRYISYNRLDPFAMTIGAAADLATKRDGMTDRQLEDASGLLVASLVNSMGDRTWLSGMSDLFSMLNDPQRNLPNYLQSQGASLVVPTGVSQVARDVDPTRRITDSVAQEIQSRIPGASSSLYPQRDIFGRPIETDRLGPEAVSPITQTQRQDDPVVSEMARLGSTATVFPKGRRVGGKWQEYTPSEYDRLQAQAGNEAHRALTQLMKSPVWRTLPPETQTKVIKDTITSARTNAKANVLGVTAQQLKKATALLAPPPPPGFKADGAAGGVNVYADLQRLIPGVKFTSGYRNDAYQADMRRRGYHPAEDSRHKDGSSFDLLPPPGRSMSWLKGQVRQNFPKARMLNEGDHLHTTFPGYYGAPAIGGAKRFGLKNPLAGMPAPPPGFKMD